MSDLMQARVTDRMRRAWAQLLREMDAAGEPLPAGADVRIRMERGDLVVEAEVIAEVPVETPVDADTDEGAQKRGRK